MQISGILYAKVWYLRFYYYHSVDATSGNISSVVSVSAWFVRYIYHWNLQFLNYVIIIKTKVDHNRFWLSCFGSLVLLPPKDFKIIWPSNLLILIVPDEGYSRNVLYEVSLIFTFLLGYILHVILYCYTIKLDIYPLYIKYTNRM